MVNDATKPRAVEDGSKVQLDPVTTVARITALEILARQLMVVQIRTLNELGPIELTPAYVR